MVNRQSNPATVLTDTEVIFIMVIGVTPEATFVRHRGKSGLGLTAMHRIRFHPAAIPVSVAIPSYPNA